MLKNDNLRLISLALCLFYTNAIFASSIKPDILESLDQIRGLDLSEKDKSRYHIWEQGMVPYYIDDFSFDKVLRDRIRFYLDQLNKATGLHFMEIPQPPEDDKQRWVFFLNRKSQLGCDDVSYNNYTNKGVQRVVLGYDCLTPEDLDEIILSLVGVPPQHNAPDRDDYVTVNWDNILPDKHYLFEKLKTDEWAFGKLKYDFSSAGHYRTHKYTSNGGETITPKNLEHYMEGRKGLSSIDIKKIRMFYNNISFKAKKPMQVPECSKLFVPGKNFSKYITPKVSVSSEKPEIICDSENASNHDCHKNKDKKDVGDDDNEDVNNDKEKNNTDIKDEKNDNKSGENNDKQDSKVKIESTEEKKILSKDEKLPNSKEKALLLLKYHEVEKIKSPNIKKKQVEVTKSKYKAIKNLQNSQTTEMKSDEDENTKYPKKLKGETGENKSVNSEEKHFLLAKYQSIKNNKYAKNTKDSKKIKGETDDNKSVNSEEKTLLLAKHQSIKNDKYAKNTKYSKKIKGETDDNKSVNSEEKNFLLAKYQSIKKNKYAENTKYSQKIKGETDNSKSLDSEEKHFLSQKNYKFGKSRLSKTQNAHKDKKSQNNNKKKRVLLKGNSNKLPRKILGKSDYETGEENVNFHFK
ncbi:hypothetical protein KGM_214088 [Danaus plexippus plexippus]|uniref:Metalloendopeptidase n=1 Tax=Danaus plexippus plexippus TaxID=278856 RepID=A0A212EY00_DANPL|nr:hypothetical protein KGM_214088 [Danaus plexippus plexippus]